MILLYDTDVHNLYFWGWNYDVKDYLDKWVLAGINYHCKIDNVIYPFYYIGEKKWDGHKLWRFIFVMAYYDEIWECHIMQDVK